MALAGSYLSPSMMLASQGYVSKVNGQINQNDANDSTSSAYSEDNSSDSTGSISEPDEFLADSFLRDFETRQAAFSPRSSVFGESPDFSKFITPSSEKTKTGEGSSEDVFPIEMKKPKLDEFQAAREAHQLLRKKRFLYEDLKLNSKRLKKDREVSVLGNLFQKVLSWSADSKKPSVKKLPEDSEITETPKTEKQAHLLSGDEEGVVHLGLTRHSVTKTKYFDKAMRRAAQQKLFKGKRNVAFLDKVEILEIPLLRKMPRKFKSRMFYSRTEFVDMIARNLKEMEIEARRRHRRRRRKQLLKR